MSMRPLYRTFALLSIVIMACAKSHSGAAAPSGDGDHDQASGGFVLSGRALEDGQGSLLSAMRGKVPNLRVIGSSRRCPQISLRSHTTFETFVEPHVYVDGTRATDTCILESLRSRDVGSVEFYPMGFTTRTGYGTHAHGLIMVFMLN